MLYHFGDYILDDLARLLSRDGMPLAVEPMVFDCLVHLIRNRDRMVSRDELVGAVWNGRFVSDATVSGRIKSARQAIGDDGKTQALVRTLHGRGFRFVGEVSIVPDSVEAQGAASAALRLSTPSVALDGSAEIGSHADLDLRPPSRPSIAVLPLRIVGDPEGREVFADGLAEDLVTRLGCTRSMFVAARGSSFRFKGPDLDQQAVAARLGVRYILSGTVQFAGDRLRISVTLTDSAKSQEVWAEAYDRRCEDVLSLQIEIVDEVAGTVETEVMRLERQRAILLNSSNLDAWTAYHRGCWHMLRFETEGFDEAKRLFDLAARLDPMVARIQAGLSFVHWQRAFLQLTKDRDAEIARAVEHAQHSISLDPRDPLAHMSMGRALLLRTGDYGQALGALERAVELNPSSAMAQYSVGYGCMLTVEADRGDRSLLAARRLSPYDMMTFAMLGVQAFNAAITGRPEQSIDFANRAANQPNVHYHALAMTSFCTAKSGRRDVAGQHLARLMDRRPDYRIADFLRAFPMNDADTRREVTRVLSGIGLAA